MSFSLHQQMQSSKRPLDSAQSRLALLSYLTEKKEGNTLFKKKSFFWDQQHLYSENLTLRSQIKELTQTNTKAKTRILEMESQLRSTEMKGYDQGYRENVLRSMSLKSISKKSLVLFRPRQDEQGKTKAMRQIVRQLRQEINSLKNQNTQLKRSIKNTRMNELQALNTEMEIQLKRLNNVASEARNKYFSLLLEFESLKNSIKRESDGKKIAVYQKNKLQNEVFRLQREKEQLEKKSEFQQKRFGQDFKKIKIVNPEISCMQPKPVLHENSINTAPKLQYSISGLDRFEGDTINFDKLLNTQSELKSNPKITSFTSLELLQKQASVKLNPTPKHTSIKEEATPKKDDYEEPSYEEEYEFQQEEQIKVSDNDQLLYKEEQQQEKQVKVSNKHYLPQQEKQQQKPLNASENHKLPHKKDQKVSDYDELLQEEEQQKKKPTKAPNNTQAPHKKEQKVSDYDELLQEEEQPVKLPNNHQIPHKEQKLSDIDQMLQEEQQRPTKVQKNSEVPHKAQSKVSNKHNLPQKVDEQKRSIKKSDNSLPKKDQEKQLEEFIQASDNYQLQKEDQSQLNEVSKKDEHILPLQTFNKLEVNDKETKQKQLPEQEFQQAQIQEDKNEQKILPKEPIETKYIKETKSQQQDEPQQEYEQSEIQENQNHMSLQEVEKKEASPKEIEVQPHPDAKQKKVSQQEVKEESEYEDLLEEIDENMEEEVL